MALSVLEVRFACNPSYTHNIFSQCFCLLQTPHSVYPSWLTLVCLWATFHQALMWTLTPSQWIGEMEVFPAVTQVCIHSQLQLNHSHFLLVIPAAGEQGTVNTSHIYTRVQNSYQIRVCVTNISPNVSSCTIVFAVLRSDCPTRTSFYNAINHSLFYSSWRDINHLATLQFQFHHIRIHFQWQWSTCGIVSGVSWQRIDPHAATLCGHNVRQSRDDINSPQSHIQRVFRCWIRKWSVVWIWITSQ